MGVLMGVRKKHWRQFDLRDRLQFEKLFNAGMPFDEIAVKMHCCLQSVHNEWNRGKYMKRNKDWTESEAYSYNIAQAKYEHNTALRGKLPKIAKYPDYAEYIEKLICDDGYSPEAAVTIAKKKFKFTLCVKTIYNLIDNGYFHRLSNKNLPVKGKRKRGYKVVHRQKKASVGTTIDERPKRILKRREFGHWEMDSVLGGRKSKNCLVVLTERKTRKEIIRKVPDHTAASVVNVLNSIEREFGNDFAKVFKTITVDNGTEFSYFNEMQNSITMPGTQRTEVFYCHAYCSSERGSNENQNKLIRRKIPKGMNFDEMSDDEIYAVEEWINTYPRRLFKGQSSEIKYQNELKKLKLL